LTQRNNNNEETFLPRFSCVVDDDIPSELRLDRYVAENIKLLSRSQIKARKLKARVNNKDVKISRILKPGDRLDFFWEDAEPVDLSPEDIALDIVYEDDRVAVVNKVQGMVAHPGAGNRSGTLANALYFCRLQKEKERNLLQMTGGTRPGIVHRLDKDTSGLIITAWDDEAHLFLAEQFKNRKVRKTYAAIVQGCPKQDTGRIEIPIGRNKKNRKLFAVDPRGKPSLTFYKVVKSWTNYSLLLLRPKTGRTHQLRVHLKYLGTPILGDPLYGKIDPRGKPSLTFYKVVKSWGNYSLLLLRPKTGRTHQLRVHLKYLGFPILGDPLYGQKDASFPNATLMLHAKRLSIVLPGNGKKTFKTKFPQRFQEIFRKICFLNV
jgi:23S rRNA pseudouridine1911/1915/1917 synthase